MGFSISKPKGTTDVSVPIMVIDSEDGTPETTYAHNTTGIDLWYRREGGSEVSITEAALAAWNSPHTDGGVEHGSNGRGRLDLPDAACAIGSDEASYVEYGGTITGMIVIGGIVNLTDPINEVFVSEIIGDTGNSTTALHVPNWSYGDNEVNDYIVAIKDVSAGEWHFRIISAWNATSNLATVATLPFTPENDTDLVCLLGYLGDGSSLSVGLATDAVDDDALASSALSAIQAEMEENGASILDTLRDRLTEARLAELDAANMPADLDAVLEDTNELQSDDVPGLIAALNNPTVNEIRNAITGGAYALDTDANGRIRLVVGTATGEVTLASGIIAADIQEVDGDPISQGGSDPASPYGVT